MDGQATMQCTTQFPYHLKFPPLITDNEYSAMDCRLVYQRAALVKLIKKTQIHPHTLIIDHAIAT